MIHYIGDISFFGSFFENPHFQNLFIFFKDINELKLRINNESFSNITLFYVGDIAKVDKIILHSGFFSKINYLFVQFLSKEKRDEIQEILSPKTSYYERHNYLKNLYKKIMDSSDEFFVYSPLEITVNAGREIILKDLSYFSLFIRKSVLKDEDALIEKTKILTKNPDNIYIADNKDNFIIEKIQQ